MIQREFDNCYKIFEPTLVGFPWESKEAYIQILSQIYHYVKHSSRIMCAVASRLSLDQEPLHAFLVQHAKEEMGHHFLAKTDLRSLGKNIEDIPELVSTRMLYEPQCS
jgi:hypothetical protein